MNDANELITDFLRKNWIKDSVLPNVRTIRQFLDERADVLTITFVLQHVRTKILGKPENFEADCGVAAKLIEFFPEIKEKIAHEIRIKEAYEQLKYNQAGMAVKNYEVSYTGKTTKYDTVHEKSKNEEWYYYQKNGRYELEDHFIINTDGSTKIRKSY